MWCHDKQDALAHVEGREHYNRHAAQKQEDDPPLRVGREERQLEGGGIRRCTGKHCWIPKGGNILVSKLKWKGTYKTFIIILDFLSVAGQLPGGHRSDYHVTENSARQFLIDISG